MFESPQAKRICRSKVFDSASSSSSSSSDEEVTETTTIKEIQDSIGLAYHFDYDLIENGAGKVTKFAHLQIEEPENVLAQAHEETAPDEEAFEFRLFAPQKPRKASDPDADSNGNDTSATRTRTLNKINIRSPPPDEASDGRFLHPHRPRSHYFTNGAATASFAISAVSGLSLLNSSHSPWPGTRLPWRVIHLPPTRLPPRSPPAPKPHLAPGVAATSRKPSKRRRIQLRTRTKLVDAKAKEKEEHLREKKTRLNRERKVKRRARDKAGKEKKEGVGEGGCGG